MTYPKLISWSYFDGKSIFSKTAKKESVTKIYAKNKMAETIAQKGLVACLLFDVKNEDPYFIIKTKEGYTKRAKNYGNIVKDLISNNLDLKNKVDNIKPTRLKDYGEYVYIDLIFLKNHVNPFDISEFFESPHFINKEKFTVKNILKLINYHPQAVFGGEIESYQKTTIPEFLLELKIQFPEIYQDLLDVSDTVKNFNQSIDYAGKVAYLNTLSPGRVELQLSFIDKEIFYWDGSVLSTKKQVYDKSEIEHIIKPSADTTVIIKDVETVNSKTIFV